MGSDGKVRWVNLTPHPINVVVDGEEVLYVPPSGTVVRLVILYDDDGEVGGVPVVIARGGIPEGVMPDPRSGTFYLVSSLVAAALPGRDDVLAPDTGVSAIRDCRGRVTAVTRLQRIVA